MSARVLLAGALLALVGVGVGACHLGEESPAPASTTEKVCTVFDDGSVLCSDGTARPAPSAAS